MKSILTTPIMALETVTEKKINAESYINEKFYEH